jgi:tricorn protease
MSPRFRMLALGAAISLCGSSFVGAQSRLLRQPTISATHVAFTYGGDLWVADRTGGTARRLTSTPAVESDPHFSPDGRRIAFTSDRAGNPDVYVVDADGGEPTRLTWYPAPSFARGWTPDGSRVLYGSSRETAPVAYDRLWTVSPAGGPSTAVPAPWGYDGAYAPSGRQIVVDRVTRWDWEWRSYRGGQNTPLTILDLQTLDEVRIPNERTTDRYPVWIGDMIYFVSDRDWAMNVWSYNVTTKALAQLTRFKDAEVKWLSGGAAGLVFEQDGWIHTLDPATGRSTRLDITVQGDFPWAETRWEDVSQRVASASLSPTGKRVLIEARGEIFTVPVEDGDARNITRTSGAADRRPSWSPDGTQIAWFSDSGDGYQLVIAPQDAMGASRRIPMGESVMAWEPSWSPDGKQLVFVDDDVRIRVVDIASGRIRTADVGGNNLQRGDMGVTWSPDSRWLAYAKAAPNGMRRIMVWSATTGTAQPVTDAMADAQSPSWDRDGRHLYFLASTDLALGSGWANTSSITSRSTYGPYVMVLRANDTTPFTLKSDEEGVKREARGGSASAAKPDSITTVQIDMAGIERRILPLPMPSRNYQMTIAGPRGTVFIGEAGDAPGMTLHKFSLSERKADVFTRGVSSVAVSQDGEKLLFRSGRSWRVVGTAKAPDASSGTLQLALRMQLDRRAEWQQIFDEAWHYERDFFYDPGMHGNDWNAVRRRYRPLVEHVRHRDDLNYILDQVNGELSVGHSFVRGGDMPAVDTVRVGLLGADFAAQNGAWRVTRIYTFESWNPGLAAPLDRPGMRVGEGTYLVGIDGVPLTAAQDPFRALDGTVGRQTVLHLNDRPGMDGAWTETVEPIRSESQLRQRGWVEDNRRAVDSLSGGRLAYAWIPNTGGPGVTSFNRYLFAQQDRAGAVIDERYNGGGNLDDYMVDYLSRTLRAALTNEVPNGAAMLLPQGVLGPKVLLINERAGSGGDYFPWAFRQQQVGPLIGARTWGGLVKSSTHYAMVDGGSLTAPDNAVFDPINNVWVAENEGVPPDIEVLLDAKSFAAGRDPQLERAVQEALRLVNAQPARTVTHPPYPRPSRRPPLE